MNVTRRPIEAFEFTGSNFDELKEQFPNLKKYTFREGYDYTVGWETDLFEQGKGFTEALPGFFLMKENGKEFILEPEEFYKRFQ